MTRLIPPRLTIVLLLLVLAALTACGGNGSTDTPASGANQATASLTASASETGTPQPTPTPEPGSTVPASPEATSATASATASPAASATVSATPAQTTVEVKIVDFKFEPETVTISPGTTVVWTNIGATIHTTTSKQNIWDSGIMDTDAVFQFTFDQPGDFPYWCTIHPEMLGTVIVK